MAFIVTAGALAITDKPAAQAPYALSLPDGSSQDYATLWRGQHQVRTVVSFLARNIAQLHVHQYRRVSDTDRQRLADHPLATLLDRPNHFTTRYRMFDSLVNDLGIFDVAYWAKVRGEGGAPGALVRLDPQKMTPEGDSPFYPEAFTLKGSRGKRVLPAEQVVYFRGFNPSNARTGCSPIEALRRTLLEEWQANGHREQLWRNGARMSGYITRPLEAPKWSDGAKRRFKADWQSQYVGDGPNAGGTPILDDGMTFNGASITPEQAEYLGARKLTREEVAAAYHVPLPMVGILEHATFSNIKEQHKHLYQDCLGPWLEMIQEELALQLAPDFGDIAGTYLEFNLQAKLQGSFEEQAAQLSTSVGAPFMTRNEARAKTNLPAVDGGDELITPLNVLVGGQASPADSVANEDTGAAPKRRRPAHRMDRSVSAKAQPTDAHVARAEKVLAAFFTRQGKAIVSALGAALGEGKAARTAGRKADEPDVATLWDDERWDGELAADLFGINTLIATACAHSTLAALGMDEDEYDEDRTLNWLTANAERAAGAVNGATKRRLIDLVSKEDALVAVTGLFATYAESRSKQLARSHATSLAGFGTTEVARQAGRETTTKTWRVRSSNPRKSHQRMDGETVDLEEKFSNGAQWPGDSSLDEDERAGCTCDVEIEFAD